MAELWSQVASSHRFQLAATAVISGATIAGLILSYQAFERGERVSELKSSIPPATAHQSTNLTTFGTPSRSVHKEDVENEALARKALAGDFDDELILEQLARNRVFLGDEGLAKLRKAFVIVVGLGGVGSHCTTALVRSGVSKIRLIDFDQVSLSSLNRHAVATLSDVGTSKVQCMHRRLIASTPWAKFDLRTEKFDAGVADKLLGSWDGQKPDFVVDAIDNIDTKVELLQYCHANKIPVISSTGAGCKSDPTQVVVGDISTSEYDPLSRATRRRLKLVGITSGIPLVYSTEKGGNGKAELLPLPEEEFQKGSVSDLGALPNFRVRILPVLGTLPAVFGYVAANHVILNITGYPSNYITAKGREKLYDQAAAFLHDSEEKIVRARESGFTPQDQIGLKIPVTAGDTSFLIEDIFNGRSGITGVPTRLVLIRWRAPEQSTMLRIGSGPDEQRSCKITLHDIVCMTKEEAKRHLNEVLKGGKPLDELYDAETIKRVEAKLLETQKWEKFRV